VSTGAAAVGRDAANVPMQAAALAALEADACCDSAARAYAADDDDQKFLDTMRNHPPGHYDIPSFHASARPDVPGIFSSVYLTSWQC
jgi:hypothetical protein